MTEEQIMLKLEIDLVSIYQNNWPSSSINIYIFCPNVMCLYIKKYWTYLYMILDSAV